MPLCSSVAFMYRINNNILVQVDSFKDLGLTYSDSCCLNAHIVSIVKHAKYLSHLLFSTFRNHSPGFHIHLFITYVRSLLQVNTVIWSPSHIYLINMIEDVQKQFTRRL